MKIGRTLLGIVACVACAFMTPRVYAQEAALRYSLMQPELRLEMGTTVVSEPGLVFGRDFRAWAGAGSTVEGGHLVGSFAGLINVGGGRSFTLELGGGYLATNLDGRIDARWDLVVQASLKTGEGSALSFAPTRRGGLGLSFARRF